MSYDQFKDDFIEARRNAMESGRLDERKQNDGVYTPQMISALRAMAQHDVWPDGNFSDIDCEIWGMFR